jgi:hypothetical protein
MCCISGLRRELDRSPDGAQRNPWYLCALVRYRRNFVAGGTYFFTATLVDRRSSALIRPRHLTADIEVALFANCPSFGSVSANGAVWPDFHQALAVLSCQRTMNGNPC